MLKIFVYIVATGFSFADRNEVGNYNLKHLY